ncbi:MAG TPA: CpsB/CapC family capsule biosynthesis tyrosine phosphatase [Clostridia bacterium]|nr:CpsB/CapC family capsule biosynthesis tyrosine phosphatase [Clostridia bacterium]
MIDIHSHLIFGVDDGSSCLDESLRMIEAAERSEINTIIATPHFQNGIFSNEGVREKFELLASKAADYHVDIRLGNEVSADDYVLKNINFDNSQYLLIEMPYGVPFENIARLIYKLSAADTRIIVAHPERNRKIIRSFHSFIQLIHTANCRIQIDAGSIVGIYGTRVKEFARHLLKIKAVDFVASNAHCTADYINLYPAAVRKLYQLCSEEYAVRLLESNAYEMITVNGGTTNYGREIG